MPIFQIERVEKTRFARVKNKGEKLYSERYNKFNFYGRSVAPKTFILKPSNAPDWTLDRQKLWNEIEKIEKSKNARLARDFILALPSELNEEEQEELLLNYWFVRHCLYHFVSSNRRHV